MKRKKYTKHYTRQKAPKGGKRKIQEKTFAKQSKKNVANPDDAYGTLFWVKNHPTVN